MLGPGRRESAPRVVQGLVLRARDGRACGALEVVGGETAQGGVTPTGVVPAFDEVERRPHGFGSGARRMPLAPPRMEAFARCRSHWMAPDVRDVRGKRT